MIRQAEMSDFKRINELLYQVHDLHAQMRPDLFAKGEKKFSDQELKKRLQDKKNPVFVYVDENKITQGYIMCEYRKIEKHPALVERKEMFIDDLCVEGTMRGKGIGESLYQHAVAIARKTACTSVTLHVWNENSGALRFYERLGMQALCTTREQRLQ